MTTGIEAWLYGTLGTLGWTAGIEAWLYGTLATLGWTAGIEAWLYGTFPNLDVTTGIEAWLYGPLATLGWTAGIEAWLYGVIPNPGALAINTPLFGGTGTTGGFTVTKEFVTGIFGVTIVPGIGIAVVIGAGLGTKVLWVYEEVIGSVTELVTRGLFTNIFFELGAYTCWTFGTTTLWTVGTLTIDRWTGGGRIGGVTILVCVGIIILFWV